MNVLIKDYFCIHYFKLDRNFNNILNTIYKSLENFKYNDDHVYKI